MWSYTFILHFIYCVHMCAMEALLRRWGDQLWGSVLFQSCEPLEGTQAIGFGCTCLCLLSHLTGSNSLYYPFTVTEFGFSHKTHWLSFTQLHFFISNQFFMFSVPFISLYLGGMCMQIYGLRICYFSYPSFPPIPFLITLYHWYSDSQARWQKASSLVSYEGSIYGGFVY